MSESFQSLVDGAELGLTDGRFQDAVELFRRAAICSEQPSRQLLGRLDWADKRAACSALRALVLKHGTQSAVVLYASDVYERYRAFDEALGLLDIAIERNEEKHIIFFRMRRLACSLAAQKTNFLLDDGIYLARVVSDPATGKWVRKLFFKILSRIDFHAAIENLEKLVASDAADNMTKEVLRAKVLGLSALRDL